MSLLQEIYGLEQAGGAKAETAVSAEDAEERLCVICLVNDRDTTVLPCRHMCMCHECAQVRGVWQRRAVLTFGSLGSAMALW